MAGARTGFKHSGIVTTCGVTSIKENPGDARVPISATKLADDDMKDLLESSGATTFFTLVRYNIPELLEEYSREKLEETKKGKKEVSSVNIKKSEKRKNTLSLSSSLSSSNEDSCGNEEETPEEIIFMLFGPRIWEYEGKIGQVIIFCSLGFGQYSNSL